MQMFIFMTCMLVGISSGIVYDFLYAARIFVCGTEFSRYKIKDKIMTVVCDLIYFIVFAGMFVFTSVLFEFYSLRLYMLAGCALGAIIYLKSLHIIIAFMLKKVYNIFAKRLRRRKTHE